MKKYLIDLHTHTNYSPHAYSTIYENVQEARKKGMLAIAMTNHGPYLQDSPHWWALANSIRIPSYIDGVRIFKGMEANIVNEKGHIDISERIYKAMDIIIGGFHNLPTYGESNIEKNTNALINTINYNLIDILVHLGNPNFPIKYEEVLLKAKEKNVAIELNNSSFIAGARKGSEKNCIHILNLAKSIGNTISLGSDAHFSNAVGNIMFVSKLVNKIKYQEDLILNSSIENVVNFLTKRRESQAIKLKHIKEANINIDKKYSF